MNLSKEQKQNIIDLHFKKLKSQNEIVSITGINKRWVNETCKAYASMQELNGMGAEATPQVTLFPTQNSFKLAQRNIDPSTPVSTPQPNNWGYANNNTHELEYKDRRIKDLEQDKNDLRRKLDAVETDLSTTKKEFQLLQLEHRTIEKSHHLELEMMRKMQELDKKPSTIDKLLENETVQKMALAGIMGKMGMGGAVAGVLGGTATTPQMEMPQVPTHPLTFNTEYSQKIAEIYELMAAFPPEKIAPFHEILSLFFGIPNSLESALNSMKKHLQNVNNQAQN